MSQLAKQLIELKETIERQQKKRDELAGSIKATAQQIKTKFNCASLKEAEARLTELQNTFTGLEKKIQTQMKEVKDALADLRG